MKPKALLVEDEPRIAEGIADVLLSLGHEHDWVKSQRDARRCLEKKNYTYILLDPQIPAKPGRGGARIDFGVNLLDDVQRLKGGGAVPVILMTAHGGEALNLATQLRAKGVADFIAKPFPQTGRIATRPGGDGWWKARHARRSVPGPGTCAACRRPHPASRRMSPACASVTRISEPLAVLRSSRRA